MHSLPNGAEGMMATYQVNGRQFVVLPVAQANGTFPAMFNGAVGGRVAELGPGGPPAADGPAGAGGRQGRGGGPQLPGAYIAFALPQ